MNNITITNEEQYSQLWKNESESFESQGVYKRLSEITPQGNTIEFGCGIGRNTHHLSTNRNVLSLEKNQYLIENATKYLHGVGSEATIHKCDFFDLTENDKKIISDFEPKVIVGWFIGSDGHSIHERTQEEPNIVTKSNLYREKIEDIIVSPDVCLESVEYIHLVSRGGLAVKASEELFNSTKEDYDTHVFNNVGFEVFDVKTIDWEIEKSEFPYGITHNPNFAGGETVPVIVSILAKRIK